MTKNNKGDNVYICCIYAVSYTHLDVYKRQEIEKEIQASEFVAVECDKTTDVTNHCQMALVFRNVFKGSVYKRFWGFLSPEGKFAETLAKCIMDNNMQSSSAHIKGNLNSSDL